MQKISLLAASVALVLSGCGSSDSDAPSLKVKAIDGYLVNADVYVGEKCETKVGATDINGDVVIPAEFSGQPLCVKAIAGITTDSSRGTVTKDFTLQAPAASAVVSPMTSLVVAEMAKDVTQADAEKAVLAKFEGLTSNPDELFGDYIADAASGSKVAEGITVIGETLVDEDLKEETLEQLIDIVAGKVENNDDDLAQFDPVIDAEAGTVTENHRPHIALSEAQQDALEEITVVHGGAIDNIDLTNAFTDIDAGDSLTITVIDEDGQPLADLGLSFNAETAILSGTPKSADEIELQAYATDSHGARSYPLDIEIDVETPNRAPVVDAKEVAELEKELAAEKWTQHDEINSSIDIDDLFDDADDDKLTFTATTTVPGLKLTVAGDDLLLSGNLTQGGDFIITVYADDANFDKVAAEIKVSVEAITAPEFTLEDFLEGDNPSTDLIYWASTNYGYFIDEGVMAGSFVDGKTYFEDDLGNMVEEGSYEINGNVISFKIEENGQVEIEHDRFIYFSEALALSVTEANDLNVQAKVDFTQDAAWTAWSTDTIVGTWYFIGDDSSSHNDIDRIYASMTFNSDNTVDIGEDGETMTIPWSITSEGFLELNFRKEEPNGNNLLLALAQQNDDMMLVIDDLRGFQPSLMVKDKVLADRLVAEWVAAK